ncbi:MAG: zinc ribbon domain-containing protein [Candidatus Pacebacteria bacterium]|nr:zinc ribbon domain-containing protein [Candidatus Paceibacterota bacterium]
MKYCSACGMPLLKKEDFAKGDESSEFCLYCVDEKGEVKGAEDIFEGGVKFFMEQVGTDRGTAEKMVRKNMSMLPYWKDKDCEVLKGEMATDEEFEAILKKF